MNLKRFAALAGVGLLVPTLAFAQPSPNNPVSSSCKKVAVNLQGSANADVTVDNTATGVLVMAASTSRCGAIIRNSGAAAMRCAPPTITVTATVGTEVLAADVLTLGLEAQEAWRCIRSTGTNAAANVTEAIP